MAAHHRQYTKTNCRQAGDSLSIIAQEASNYPALQKLLLQTMLQATGPSRMEAEVSRAQLEEIVQNLYPELDLRACTDADLCKKWRCGLICHMLTPPMP